MSNAVDLIVAGLAGTLLGIIFFGGLWWTVRKCLREQNPAVWLITSVLLRMSITLVGFYIVGAGQWPRLIACLVGFIAARMIITRLSHSIRVEARQTESSIIKPGIIKPSIIKPSNLKSSNTAQEVTHAS